LYSFLRDPLNLPEQHMLIDAHQHFWNPARGDYGWMTPELVPLYKRIGPHELKPHLDRHGIGKTILVQAAPTIEETEYMLGIADATEWVAGVVGWIDFENRTHLKHLERLAKHPKFKGVRPMIQDLPDDKWMLRPDLDWAFRALVDLGLHFEALGFPRHLDHFHTLFKRYPDLPIVIDHAMKPQIRDGAFDDWAYKMAHIAEQTPVLCKFSALVTEAKPGWTTETIRPYADHLLATFGSERLIWGSDWPVLNMNGDYDTWWMAAHALIPTAHHVSVFGGNAARFYRL
jgi:L-fuconolactonase